MLILLLPVVTTVWYVFWLHKEEKTCRCEGYLQIYSVSSLRWPARCGPELGSGVGLTSYCKILACYRMLLEAETDYLEFEN
jgi:hypothetical protein